VVEVQLDLIGSGGCALIASELELLDKVLVRDLCKASSLVSIKVDVINPERGSLEGRSGDASRCGEARGSITELEVDLDLVVLQGNQRKGKARVSREPELKRDVKSKLRNTGGSSGDTGPLGELRDVSDHVGITFLVTGSLSELVPDVEPISPVLVNALATDLDFNVLDEDVTDPVEPAELLASSERHLRKSDLKVSTEHKITVSGDGASDLASKIGISVESLFNRLHGEVSVTTVDDLEESDLRVASQVNVLGTVSDKLHKTSSHFRCVC